MVGVASASASLGSCRVACPAASDPPRPSSVAGSLRCPAIRGLGTDKGTISAISGRGVLPLVGAVKQTFPSCDEILEKSDKPVLVDSYATWCGPSQYLVPVLDRVSAIFQSKIQIVKIDTQMESAAAIRYHIEALPAFNIFRDGGSNNLNSVLATHEECGRHSIIIYGLLFLKVGRKKSAKQPKELSTSS